MFDAAGSIKVSQILSGLSYTQCVERSVHCIASGLASSTTQHAWVNSHGK